MISDKKIICLDCACCGGYAPAHRQWYNQDDGYGVCKDCFDLHVQKYGEDTAKNYFGLSGVHHSLAIKDGD
jgi:hypothetical protein